jgi:hypothetical protein
MRILLVSTIRNEGPFLLDWIAHHKAAGVTDFLVFSNDCADGSDRLLDTFQATGWLTHLRHKRQDGVSIQWQALKSAWQHPLRKLCDWALVCDADEYLCLKSPALTLPELIGALPASTDAMALPWRMFGANGVAELPSAPVPEIFTQSAAPDCSFPAVATMIKTLFRLRGPFRGFGIHRPAQKDTPRWVDGSGQPLPPIFAENPARLSLYGLSQGRDLAEMNHYALRGAASFLIKRDRGLPNRKTKDLDLGYWVERNFNTLENTAIARMAPQTALERASLLALPGVATLHAAAQDWHRARAQALLETPEGYTLYSRLLLASQSLSMDAAQARQLYAIFARTRQEG